LPSISTTNARSAVYAVLFDPLGNTLKISNTASTAIATASQKVICLGADNFIIISPIFILFVVRHYSNYNGFAVALQ